MEKTARKIDEYTANWYVVYTATKAERKVNKQLEQSCFETYLPLQSVVRVWNSQKRKVMIPFIPRIIFVCLSANNIEQILTLEGGSLLLQKNGEYVSVSIEQMNVFRKAMEHANKPVIFLPEDFSSETPLSMVSGSPLHFVGGVHALSIEGVGTVLMNVENSKSLESKQDNE